MLKVYNYQCPSCNHTFEAFVKNQDDEVPCKKCNTPTTRQLSAPNFKLNGVGCYGHGSMGNPADGPYIPNHIKEMSDVELNRSLGLPDDA